MNGNQQARKERADAYLPEIKSILGQKILGEASLEEDRLENTDLRVLVVSGLRIACRVRGTEHAHYREFTLRSRYDSGAVAELAKVLEGYGDWAFYGYVSARQDGSIDPWWIVNLRYFRRLHENPQARTGACMRAVHDRPNGWKDRAGRFHRDGSYFRPYPFAWFDRIPGCYVWTSARAAMHASRSCGSMTRSGSLSQRQPGGFDEQMADWVWNRAHTLSDWRQVLHLEKRTST
jgi:hypothetical protein